MVRFLNQVTQVLANIFNFEGSLNSLSRIDLTSDIQPVFDLARGTGWAKSTDFATTLGLVGLRVSNAHVAAGTLFGEFLDVYAVQAAGLGIPETNIWVWLMDLNCNISGTTALFGGAQCTLVDPDIEGTSSPTGRGRLLGSWDTVLLAAAAGGRNACTNLESPETKKIMPYLLTPGSGFQIATNQNAAGAMTANVEMRIWVGPRFAAPPGA